MKIYKGERLSEGGVKVVVIENEIEKPLIHKAYHSPTGFEWGYLGSGPADLARSILWDFVKEESTRSLYMKFKEDFVSGWGDKWQLTGQDIDNWLKDELGAK
jgi:hypothetical protein